MTNAKTILETALNAAQTIPSEVASLDELAITLRASAGCQAVNYDAVSVQASPDRGGLEDVAIALADISGQIRALQTRLGQAILAAEQVISGCSDPVDRTLLRRHYIMAQDAWTIGSAMHMSPRTVYRRISKAAASLDLAPGQAG